MRQIQVWLPYPPDQARSQKLTLTVFLIRQFRRVHFFSLVFCTTFSLAFSSLLSPSLFFSLFQFTQRDSASRKKKELGVISFSDDVRDEDGMTNRNFLSPSTCLADASCDLVDRNSFFFLAHTTNKNKYFFFLENVN